MTDLEGLQALGADPGDVSQLIAECFNEMIFCWGDVHCGGPPSLGCFGLFGSGMLGLRLNDLWAVA